MSTSPYLSTLAIPHTTRLVTRVAFTALVGGLLGVAASYLTAFFPASAAASPWLMATAMPVSLMGMLLLGAIRQGRPLGALVWAFAVVLLIIAGGFLLALLLPAETTASPLWLGLPRRAAVILYGVGVLPLFILPVAYAVSFSTRTLSDDDLDRVRAARRPETAP